MSEMLLERHKKKSFLHRIVIGDEELIHHDNPKCKKSYVKYAIPVQNYLENSGWEVLPHPPYSPDLAPSDYYLFRSMQNALTGRRFTSESDEKGGGDTRTAT